MVGRLLSDRNDLKPVPLQPRNTFLPMQFYQKIFLIPILAATQSAGFAESTITPEEAIQMALRNNRELAIAKSEVARAGSRARWAGRLDNPELEISATDDSIGLDDSESVLEIGFSQKFPLTARLREEKNVRKTQVILAEAEIVERRRHLALEVDQQATELLATRNKITLSDELVALNKKVVNFLKEQVKRGEVSNLDVTQATLSGRSLEQQAMALRNEAKREALALKKLLGVEPGSEIRLGGNLPTPVSKPDHRDDLDAILQRRPDYLLALAQTDVAKAEIALAEADTWEDVTIRVFLESEKSVDEPDGLERNTFAGVGFSIPLPLRDRNQEGIEQAEIGIDVADQTVEANVFNIRSEYEAAFQERLAAYEIATESTGEVIDLAEKNLEDFRTAYEQGQASLIQVQRAQEQLLELRNASVDMLEAFHLAEARLRFVAGNYPEIQTSHAK